MNIQMKQLVKRKTQICYSMSFFMPLFAIHGGNQYEYIYFFMRR